MWMILYYTKGMLRLSFFFHKNILNAHLRYKAFLRRKCESTTSFNRRLLFEKQFITFPSDVTCYDPDVNYSSHDTISFYYKNGLLNLSYLYSNSIALPNDCECLYLDHCIQKSGWGLGSRKITAKVSRHVLFALVQMKNDKLYYRRVTNGSSLDFDLQLDCQSTTFANKEFFGLKRYKERPLKR